MHIFDTDIYALKERKSLFLPWTARRNNTWNRFPTVDQLLTDVNGDPVLLVGIILMATGYLGIKNTFLILFSKSDFFLFAYRLLHVFCFHSSSVGYVLFSIVYFHVLHVTLTANTHKLAKLSLRKKEENTYICYT